MLFCLVNYNFHAKRLCYDKLDRIAFNNFFEFDSIQFFPNEFRHFWHAGNDDVVRYLKKSVAESNALSVPDSNATENHCSAILIFAFFCFSTLPR